MAHGIAIKIDEELLRDIHVRAAEKGLSTQQYITGLMEQDLFPERFPELSETQLEEVKEALEKAAEALERVTEILDAPESGMTMGPLS